jgi:hypothetical protein
LDKEELHPMAFLEWLVHKDRPLSFQALAWTIKQTEVDLVTAGRAQLLALVVLVEKVEPAAMGLPGV